jgi:predicted HD phosphohydrolase
MTAPCCVAFHHVNAPSRSDVVLSLLESLRGHDTSDGVDDYQHSLQTATRAERAGADPELVLAALLHDSGKAVTFRRHDRVAAEMLAGAVRPEVVWMVGVHEEFTSRFRTNGRAKHARYRHVLHPAYGLAKRFADEWDAPSRDPEYATLPLEHFAPLVHELFGRAKRNGPDRWSRVFRTALDRLPADLAGGIDRATATPRRLAKARYRR